MIIHLPAHIRRFGPAVLFATESFESFNAVIRAKSIHSNRLAPSRDIALAFAHNNRVRHLVSGGRHFFRDSEQSRKYILPFKTLAHPYRIDKISVQAGEAGIWRQVSTAAVFLGKDLFTATHTATTVNVGSRFGRYDPLLCKCTR